MPFINCSTPQVDAITLSLVGNPADTLPANATNVTYTVVSGGGSVAGDLYNNPNPVTGLNTVEIERCYDAPIAVDCTPSYTQALVSSNGTTATVSVTNTGSDPLLIGGTTTVNPGSTGTLSGVTVTTTASGSKQACFDISCTSTTLQNFCETDTCAVTVQSTTAQAVIGDCPTADVIVNQPHTFTATGCPSGEYFWRVQGNEIVGNNTPTYVRAWTLPLVDREVCVACKETATQTFAEVPVDAWSCCTPFDVIADNTLQTRQSSLLDSPHRVGYGASTTGAGLASAGSEVVVTNTNNSGPGSLRDALGVAGSWVIYDTGLNGQKIDVDAPQPELAIAGNVTWDGRDALVQVGSGILPNNGFFRTVEMNGGNTILHRVLIHQDNDYSTNNPTGASVSGIRVGSNDPYWLDHVEVEHTNDDALGIGDASSFSAVDVTVTFYKCDLVDKGLLTFQDRSAAQNAGRTGRVSIACCELAANQRNFRNSGGNFIHGWNNYVHDFSIGMISSHGSASNRDGTDTPVILAESNVFEDNNTVGLWGDMNNPPAPAIVQGWVFTDGLNQYLGGTFQGNFVIDPGDPNPSGEPVPVPPYDYSACFIPASQVKAKVLANAGVNGANIIYPPFA